MKEPYIPDELPPPSSRIQRNRHGTLAGFIFALAAIGTFGIMSDKPDAGELTEIYNKTRHAEISQQIIDQYGSHENIPEDGTAEISIDFGKASDLGDRVVEAYVDENAKQRNIGYGMVGLLALMGAGYGANSVRHHIKHKKAQSAQPS